MKKVTLYQIDSKGKTRQWSIWTEKISDKQYDIVTEDGIEGGKLKGSRTPITQGLGKNTIEQQAIADAQSVLRLKEKKGMVADKTQMKTKGQTATIKAPMKAETYKPFPKDDKERKTSYTLDKAGIRGKKVGVQRKLDGWRLRVKVNKDEVVFYTSSGDETLSFPQIEAAVRKAFDKNVAYWEKKYGVTEHILDGELYTHNLNVIRDAKDKIIGYEFIPNTSGFGAAASAGGSGKGKSTQADLSPMQKDLRDQLQFHLFDVAIDDNTVMDSTRQKIVEYYIDNKVVMPVETIYVIADEVELEKLMKQFLSEGYEGLMIKLLNTPYVFDRSEFVFKYKPLIDSEYKCIGFKKSITGETLGSIKFITEDGVEFFGNPMMTDAQKKEVWDNQSKYLGKWATCIFLEYTKDGAPRHPRVKGWRKGKSQD